MLVKIGAVASINMTGIQKVSIVPHKEVKQRAGLFQKEVTEESVAVKVEYTDHNGRETSYTLYGYKDYQGANVTYKEVLDQVKELENVGATQALEEAIRNG